MKEKTQDLPIRRSIRLKDFDYSQAGNYFVTLCAHNRHSLFGAMEAGAVRLSPIGQVVTECWFEIPRHFAGVELPAFVAMPNHIHGLLLLYQRARHAVPLQNGAHAETFGGPVGRSLPTILRSFKSAVTKRVRETLRRRTLQVWQRGYFERVIRNAREFGLAQQYILQNPIRWEFDRENPLRKPSPALQENPFEESVDS